MVMNNAPYAGDITPQQAWEMLQTEPDATLIDVRTDAEFSFVGLTDLSTLQKQPQLIAWKVFPTMECNEDFADQVEAIAANHEAPLLFLCRSGVRSKYAAIEVTTRGYHRCYNISGGFEGDHDDNQHRGTVNGWKVDNLPWKQQ